MTALNLVFAGTPAFGLPCLEALLLSKHHIKAVYTQPDRPAGRGRKLQGSAIKSFALAHLLPVFQPDNFKTQATIDELAALQPDVLIVIAYGLILPQRVLDIPRYGCINVHASILPHWRGASPIQHAILRGDTQSGVTIMRMDAGMDTGDILDLVTCNITESDTTETLHDKLALLASNPLLKTLDAIGSLQSLARKQDAAIASYAPKIKKEDAAIDWHMPAVVIDRQIRAFNPWPIAYTHANDLIMRIYKARPIPHTTTVLPGTVLSLDKKGLLVMTSEDALLIEQVQFPGKKQMAIADWLNSSQHQLHVGLVLRVSK